MTPLGMHTELAAGFTNSRTLKRHAKRENAEPIPPSAPSSGYFVCAGCGMHSHTKHGSEVIPTKEAVAKASEILVPTLGMGMHTELTV